MSLDARLKQGLSNLADPIAVDYDLGLVRVRAVARQRERRNVTIAAFAGAVAAVALLALGGRVADLVLGIEVPLPTVVDPDLEDDRGIDESRFDDRDSDRVIQDDDLRIDEALDESSEAGTIEAAVEATRTSESGGERTAPSRERAGSSDDSVKKDDSSQPPAPTTRTAEDDYTGAAVPVGGGAGCEDGAQSPACASFDTEPGERFVSISIDDQGGGAVYAAVQIDRDADGVADGEFTYICSETEGPVAIPSHGRAVIYVEIYSGTCDDGRDSNPVRGTVTARFAT